ncbi:MAG TPA: nucleotidyltransferase domain-containing protein [Polyangiaceae bacterium]|nr:nucleotidyltransferase domain-containing protein [Polyangiaceae bacterium]
MSGAVLDPAIAGIIGKFPEIAAAWLFGSEARGDAGPTSDIDIALLFEKRGTTALQAYELLGRLAAQLERVAPGRGIDLVLIEQQGPVFQHRVLEEGRLVYDGDPRRRVDFESDAMVRFLDFEPSHRLASRYATAGLERWLEAQR